jgi:hypothetical protein
VLPVLTNVENVIIGRESDCKAKKEEEEEKRRRRRRGGGVEGEEEGGETDSKTHSKFDIWVLLAYTTSTFASLTLVYSFQSNLSFKLSSAKLQWFPQKRTNYTVLCTK